MTSRLGPAVAGMLIALGATAFGSRVAMAQGPAGDHEQHHPGAPSASRAVPEVATPPPMASPAVECCGPRPGPLMPALMDLGRLSESDRAALGEAAESQVVRGLDLMEEGSREFSQARRDADGAALERAAEKMRGGLALWEMGVAARRALTLPPADARAAAATWFKRQMNLEGAPESARPRTPWGFSWAHLGAMAVLAALVLGGIALYLYRVRRALAALDRLTGDGASS